MLDLPTCSTVIVTGSRKWSSMSNIRELKNVLDELCPDVVVHGGADGADTVAHNWCKVRGKIAVVYFPNYDKYKKSAPLKRNICMLDAYPEAIVVACPLPGGTGTKYTMQAAEDRYMEVVVVSNE